MFLRYKKLVFSGFVLFAAGYISLLCPCSAFCAEQAVLDKNGQSDWYGAYLLDSEFGDVKLATLRRGLVVDVVSKGERRIEVQVREGKSPLVIPHEQSITGLESITGWVSPRYLKITPLVGSDSAGTSSSESTDLGTVDAGNADSTIATETSVEEDSPSSMFSDLINRFRGSRSSSEADSDSSVTDNPTTSSSGTTLAVLDKAGSPDWYGAYIMDSADGGKNIATLRKGVTVEILEQTPTRCRVRVINSSDPGVIGHSSSAGDGEIIGWVSTRFLNVLEEEPPVEVPVTEEDDDEGSLFSDLRNRFTGLFGSDDESEDEGDADTEEDNQSDSSSSVAAMGSKGNDPGNEPWRENLPNVYYVFADLGKDGNHFSALASGRTNLGSSSRVVKNHIESMIKSDISSVGRSNTIVIRVKASRASEVTNILRDGKLPPGRISSSKLYTEDELIGSPCNIAGFCVIAHASTDGPVVGDGDSERSQLTKSFLLGKTGSGDWSMTNRLVKGARISFFGCNTANCQYFLDHSSIAHLLAGTFAERNVITRGKKGIGNPNSSESAYALFGLKNTVAIRLTPDKKDYTFYVPLKNFEDENSGRKWVYDQISVAFSSEEEKKELEEYYKKRGLKVDVRDREIVVDAPRIGKVTESSKKDGLLLDVVRAIDSKKNLSRWDRFLKWTRIGSDTEEMTRAQAIMPQLKKLLNDSDLDRIIRTVREENNGNLDENDFRIWFRIYFQNYDNNNDRGSIATRACLCDDRKLTRR